jgi:hypothetical protein
MNREILYRAARAQTEYHQMLMMFFMLSEPPEDAVKEIVSMWANQMENQVAAIRTLLSEQPLDVTATILEFKR